VASPTTRVLAALELLQTHGRMTGAELARRLGVDRRTVRRYVVRLEELGIPVAAERGRDGAYMLVAGYKLPPMMFTDGEALAVSVGLVAARGLGLAEAAASVASAQAKLERVMPAGLTKRLRAIDETVSLELSRPHAPEDNTALQTLAAAARSQVRVRMRYGPAKGEETERDFDPWGLAYRGGCWYAVGMCHLRHGLRSFRLDRVLSVRALEVGFGRPEGFDALSYLTFSVATMPHAHPYAVHLETDLETARREVFSALGVLSAANGGVRLEGQVDDLAWLARQLARLPFDFRVVRPAALRAALRGLGKRLLAVR
jgi:predicted DNA-binding transcriptional regulator YafY